jgi:signal transduction histidine kinase
VYFFRAAYYVLRTTPEGCPLSDAGATMGLRGNRLSSLMKKPTNPPPYSPATTSQSIFDFFQRDRALIVLQLTIILVMAVDFAAHTTNFIQNIELFTFTILLATSLVIMPKLAHLAGIRGLLIHSLFHLMIGVFLVFIAPLGSPYELLAVLVMYTASYWYGSRGFLVSFVFFAVVFQAAYFYQSKAVFAIEPFSQLNMKLIVLGLIGALIDRLHALDIRDRNQLLKVSGVLSYERERLRSLINSMGDAVVATDMRGKVLVYNGAALELLNTNVIKEGKSLAAYMQTYSQKKHPIDLVAEARRSESLIKRDDILLKVNNHEYINLYTSIAQIHLPYRTKGEEGFILVFLDITKEKSIEEQRDEFISVISHELRTPITIAEANISTAQLPSVRSDPDKLADLLDQAHQNVVFLSELVNDITTLTHAERGDLEAKLEDVDPGQLVDELMRAFRPQAKQKHLKLKMTKPASIPTVQSNAYRLNEILTNLMTNAIKYTEKGTIAVAISQPDKQHIRFSVTDSGIGMTKSDQQHAFHKFWRSEDYRTRSHSGTGLGLYISAKLAERMHGTLTVESQLNLGSTFSLTIPLTIGEK